VPFVSLANRAQRSGQGTLDAAIADALKQSQEQAWLQGQGWGRDLAPLIAFQRRLIEPLVSLTLYLCSTAAELRDARGTDDQPRKPRETKTKHGPRLFPPDRPRVWEAAYRLGRALRQAQERGTMTPGQAHGERSHVRPRPHIRAAHWHHYWRGSRREGRPGTELILHWLHPMLVGGTADALIPTIHPVEPSLEGREA
jgi:hypothetical protein